MLRYYIAFFEVQVVVVSRLFAHKLISYSVSQLTGYCYNVFLKRK
jgi:hypothetical protein